MTVLRDRVWGAYVGVALGDAMGMSTECWTLEKIRTVYPDGIDDLLPSPEDDVFGRKFVAGQITDDTINTVMIHEMVVNNHGEVNTDSYIRMLADWTRDSEKAKYVSGPSTLKALAAYRNGEPLERCGITGTTNGAAMKVGPLGILRDYRNPENLINTVYEVCMPTHNTRVAIQGASVVAAAVSYAVRGGDSVNMLWSLADQFVTAAAERGFDFPSANLKHRFSLARKILSEETSSEQTIERLYGELGTGMETLQSVPAALAVVQLAEGDPIRAAEISATIGWDTDTIGAISTQICGAMHPERLNRFVSRLEIVNELDFEKMTQEILPYVEEIVGRLT